MTTLLIVVLVFLLLFFAVSFIINVVVMILLCKGGERKSAATANPPIDAEQAEKRIHAASREASRHMDNASRQMESRMEKMHASAQATATTQNPMRSVELAPFSSPTAETSTSNPMLLPAASKETSAPFDGVNPMNANTGRTPLGTLESTAPPASVTPWAKHVDESGNAYWFNTVTNQASWHDPDLNPLAELHQHEDSEDALAAISLTAKI
jgi:hypothetical protein